MFNGYSPRQLRRMEVDAGNRNIERVSKFIDANPGATFLIIVDDYAHVYACNQRKEEGSQAVSNTTILVGCGIIPMEFKLFDKDESDVYPLLPKAGDIVSEQRRRKIA